MRQQVQVTTRDIYAPEAPRGAAAPATGVTVRDTERLYALVEKLEKRSEVRSVQLEIRSD